MNNSQQKTGFEEVIIDRRMVTRVTKWGRRMSFRVVVLVGNKKWKVGLWVWKGPDVVTAVRKATHDAYKHLIEVPIEGDAATVPYPIVFKYKSAIIKLIPAAPGTGLKAGSSIRRVLELAWYHNILSKRVGTRNVLVNALATLGALSRYKKKRKSRKLEN
jgi:small subunit ribosomal protein S5